MRVAIVTESFLPTFNGVTTSVCRVTECLVAAGHDVLLVAPRPAPESYAGCPVHGVASVPVRGFPLGMPSREIEDVLRGFGPDVVHVASPFVLGASALATTSRLGLPSVAVYQTDLPSYLKQHAPAAVGAGASRAAWRWLRRLHGMADLTLAPSTAALADLDTHGVARTALWGRGVDTRQFSPHWRLDAGTRALRRRLSPQGEVVVGYVGRLAPEKELDRLLPVATLPGTRLVLVGDGPDHQRIGAALTRTAESAGAPAPALLGRRDGDDLARAYAALDVFVHTGTRETFGQTLQEAAATGLPVTAPARGGPLDLVDHSRTGLLFDPDDPSALVDAVRHLVGDRAKREALGRGGLERVAGRSWASVTGALVDHYEHVAAGHRVA
ncbi:glycosyltransferase family 1 protein [Phycicoccus sp. 3266]|uniref:glycosyltransferase family 4 protein n=1 Tax=Phycicoccus sp. 3266 TaxID=2817751 RepID=UPI00285906AE|nr:glycosyltransferase family 1 protein [Phycicoccus sp. 3266]MDR6862370.1 phosphatidylinositol alpha 1,6-mannosyltransferase [Phycicoccus sp. 3266]